ncbi:hypothetical protein PZI23_03835 [Staphylococcus argenteus]|nr:hypothetical protein [Staphylococcus argenteus]MDH9763082.1 hypothetical protein [Staphylococcus argenteus]MDH9861553.1 hypothetical protein [Staphylococcus argenteus]MDH9864225.1 hypothetical protein [Staphylococcus argenteus]MDH9866696.1 hypothetical protein [Staphylococcus argenteus]MDH9871646.1 hypothetical protein [Staphylococcus argenteus]
MQCNNACRWYCNLWT